MNDLFPPTNFTLEKKRNWWGPPHLGLMEKVEETLKETW